MATAEELFRTADYAEPHIIINGDRSISVPNELKYLGVQYDHNIETVVFDCPRYWDGYDLTELDIYINYTDVGGVLGAHHCMDVSVSETNENIINFSWTILQNLTLVPGKIAFLICAQKVNDDSTVEQCWHSRLCTECEILPGMECAHGGSEDEVIVPDNYDMGNFIMSYMPEEAITDALVSYLKTATGPVLYPITTFDAVRATNGENLTKVLSDINNNINNAQESANNAQATADNAIPRSGGEFTDLVYMPTYGSVLGDSWNAYRFLAGDKKMRGEMMISDKNNIHFNQRETGSNYADRYKLPDMTSGLTADKWYNILTSKTPVTIAQGGTGVTTVEEASVKFGGIVTFAHSKNGTVHTLTGPKDARYITFTSVADWNEGDSLYINDLPGYCYNEFHERCEGEVLFKKMSRPIILLGYASGYVGCFFKLGGAGLNFKVVNGESQPASPKENTLWVNTPTEISSWDFSPTQPFLRSKTKNLIVYPYISSGSTSNGITFTINSDGTVTVNGTATAQAAFNLTRNTAEERAIYLTPGTYTLSGCTGGSSKTYGIALAYSYDGGATWSWKHCYNAPVTFTLTSSAIVRVNVDVVSGVTVSNVKISPQLEKGSSATSFVKGSANGQVWFVTGINSDIEINTIKKNGIWEKIVAVYVLGQNGTWVAKTVKAYIGGKWIDSDIYIFSASHGINKGSWKVNRDGTVTVTADDIYLTTKDYTSGYTVCSEGVDVTNLTKVVFNVSDFYKNDSEAIYTYVGIASASTADNAFVSKVQVTAVNEYTIDVTSLSGIYYPKIQLNAHGHDSGYKSRIRVNSIKFCY